MGLWAAYVLVRSTEVRADLGEWAPGEGTVAGWSAYVTRSADPLQLPAPWSELPGPKLTAVVMASDVALLVGWDGGEERFRWLFNEQNGVHYGFPGPTEEPDEQTQTARRQPAVAAMVEWARSAGLAGDGPRLDDILDRGYVFAEEGLFAALAELGVSSVDGIGGSAPVAPFGLDFEKLAASDDPLAAIMDLFGVQPQALVLTAGDASLLPTTPRTMFLAVPIDYSGPAWDDFVVEWELEDWGQPGCLIARSVQDVPAGALTSYGMWEFTLGSEPAIILSQTVGPLGGVSFLPATEPWQVIPEEYTDAESAVAWARAHVGTSRTPPSANRERVQSELAEQMLGIDLYPSPMSRAGEASLGCELYTYTDLAVEHTSALTDWLTRARQVLIDPVVQSYGDRVLYPSGEGDVLPYGVSVTISTKSVKGRWSHMGGDPARWERALGRLRDGELNVLSLSLDRLNGQGTPSRYRSGITVSVELRDQFCEATGPIPDGHPATIVMNVPRSLLGYLDADGSAAARPAVLGLMKDAATRFDVATGYMHGSGLPGQGQSPFERRGRNAWHGERLDSMSRGVHWGNLVGAGHLAAIGGLGRLERLLADGQIVRLEPWSQEPELWWYEILPDPFGSCNEHADRVAEHLGEVIPRTR